MLGIAPGSTTRLPIRERHGLFDAVRHKEDGFPGTIPQPLQDRSQRNARLFVECAEWFVHEEPRRVNGKGSRHGGTLHRTTGRLVGKRVQEIARADLFKMLFDPLVDLGVGQPECVEGKRDDADLGWKRAR
jgi:hypothetical protein